MTAELKQDFDAVRVQLRQRLVVGVQSPAVAAHQPRKVAAGFIKQRLDCRGGVG